MYIYICTSIDNMSPHAYIYMYVRREREREMERDRCMCRLRHLAVARYEVLPFVLGALRYGSPTTSVVIFVYKAPVNLPALGKHIHMICLSRAV